MAIIHRLPGFPGPGDKYTVQLLVDNGAEVNAQDNDGRTPLHNAAMCGAVEIAEFLILKGADVDAKGPVGATPLHWAARGRMRIRPTLQIDKVVELLVANGTNIHARDDEGRTPLHSAVLSGNKIIAEFLMTKGADLGAETTSGLTMLHVAAMGGNSELVEFFASKGADINATDDRGSTPLHLAVEKRRTSVIEKLIKLQANMELRNNEGDTPLMIAARKEYKGYSRNKMTDLLIAGGAKADAAVESLLKTGLMPLHEAAKAGDFDKVQSLISAGANVDAKDRRGRRPLHDAAGGGHLETVKVLIANGAQVDATYEYGFTPLLIAANEGHKDVVELLLKNGADINAKDGNGDTALSKAVLFGHRDVVGFLLIKGADVTAGSLGRHVSLDDVANKDFEELAQYLVAEYGPYSVIVTDPASVRERLRYWKIDFEGLWIPKEVDLKGLDATLKARLQDPAEIKAKAHFRREFILNYLEQYSREYSGITRDGLRYIICQMILPHHFPTKPPENTFTQIHGFANGVVHFLIEVKTKKVVKIDCEYWM